MKYLYLAILLFSITGLVLIDYKAKLAFFDNPMPAAKSIVITMAILLFVDVIGINWNIFTTNQRFVSGINLANPNLPIEEIFFLFLLCYFVLSFSNFLKRKADDV